MILLLTNKKDGEQYLKELDSYTEAKEWISNHLDLSKEWSVTNIENKNNALYNYYINGGKIL